MRNIRIANKEIMAVGAEIDVGWGAGKKLAEINQKSWHKTKNIILYIYICYLNI